MKRICFIMSDSLSYQTLAYEHLRALKSKGVKITCLFGGDKSRLEASQLLDFADFVDVGITRKPSFFRDLLTLFKVSSHFVFYRYDTVVYSTPKAMLLGSLATAITFQKRRVCIVRGRAYENSKGLKRKIFTLLDSLTFFLSHEVFFISESLKEEYGKEFNITNFNVPSNGSSKGVDTARFSPLSLLEINKIKTDFGLSPNVFTISLAGRLCKDKGADKVLQLTKLIESKAALQFIIVGEVEDDYGQLLLDNIQATFGCVYFRYMSDIEKAFQISDLNLFLSLREGFGNVAIEAASCNVKTLAFDVVGVKDSVKSGVTGFKFKLSELNKIAKLIESEVEQKNVGTLADYSCRDYIVDRFDSKLVCDEYCKTVYKV